MLKAALMGFAVGAAVGLIHIASVHAAWRPWGPETTILVLFTTYGLMLVSALVAGLVPVALLGLLARRTRRVAARFIVASVVALAAMVLSLILGFASEGSGVRRMIADAAPLVEAIKCYEKATGTPPARLGDLVPGYLPAVPSTGASAFPTWSYRTATAEGPGRWWLSVHVGTLIMDWKHLEYDPEGHHPERATVISGNWVIIDP